MKKTLIAILTIAAMLMTMMAFAAPVDEHSDEQPIEMALVEGVVIEITSEGYLISTKDTGMVLALLSADTIMETAGDVVPGEYVFIDYDGMMTRSIPAQITAQIVRMHKLEGDVVEAFPEDNAVLLNTAELNDVYLHLPEEWAGKELTETHLTVYHNGIMTMSLPPQMGAAMIVPGYSVNGMVTELGEGTLTIGSELNAVQVNFAEGVLPEGVTVGSAVRVIYNGMMTRSIPAQITADSIEVIGM